MLIVINMKMNIKILPALIRNKIYSEQIKEHNLKRFNYYEEIKYYYT